MKRNATPILDSRDAAKVFAELLARGPAYVPELKPTEGQPAWALYQIFARYMQVLIERLNQAPDKNRLAFLDTLGIELIPAQPARAPVVFRMSEQATDSRLPAKTRLVAPPPPESTEQIVFESEQTIGLAAARIKQVVSLWPGRDQFIDHTDDFLAGRRLQLFKKSKLKDTPHVLYIAHDTLLALAGKVNLDVDFELSEASDEHLNVIFQYWDGKVWRGFKRMDPTCVEETEQNPDGTAGFTRSGRWRLQTDCAKSEKTTVNNTEAFWIRGKLREPLIKEPGQVLPEINRVRLSSTIERPLTGDQAIAILDDVQHFCDPPPESEIIKTGLLPDKAFANGEALDLTKPFFPYGQQPQPGDAFYFSSEEIFSKPGALVEILVCRTRTPQDEIVLPGQPAVIRVIPDPNAVTVLGDTRGESNVTVEVVDTKNGPVVNGTRIILTTSLGAFERDGEQTTEIEVVTGESGVPGSATVMLVSEEIGPAEVKATSGAALGVATIFFRSAQIELIADPSPACEGRDPLKDGSTIKVTVKDFENQPVADTVNLEITEGIGEFEENGGKIFENLAVPADSPGEVRIISPGVGETTVVVTDGLASSHISVRFIICID